jgi:hypothetical protein
MGFSPPGRSLPLASTLPWRGGISACASRITLTFDLLLLRASVIVPLGEAEGVKRRQALVRNAAPLARLAVGPVPPAGGTPIHDADRHAFRRFTAAIFVRARRASH